MHRPLVIRLLVAFCLTSAVSASGQVAVPVGSEIQVNSYTTGAQTFSDVALEPDGDFVITWDSPRDGTVDGVFAQRFTSAGTPVAVEFQVNTYTIAFQGTSAVAASAAGFVVAWSSIGQDGSDTGVFGRRFGSNGTPLAAEFQVNNTTVNAQTTTDVAMDSDGDGVIVWRGNGNGDDVGVFARRFASAGTPLGVELKVNSTTAGSQSHPTVDSDDDGDFVVAWRSSDADSFGIFGQRFISSGSPSGPEFQINLYVTGYQTSPTIGLDATGNFTVAWTTNGVGVFGRRFDAGGTPIGIEFQVNVYVTGSQEYPSLAADRDGDFVVTWQGDYTKILARRFKAGSLLATPDLQASTSVATSHFSPSVASAPGGDFVVTWSVHVGAQYEVLARRFEVSTTIDVDGDGQFLPLTDGLLLLRFGFGFTGNTLITGVVGGGCTRCDAPSITAYLQSLV